MIFTKPIDYDNTEVLSENGGRPKLPKGGYVLKVMAIEEGTSMNNNPYLLLSLDVAEGEYMGFFAEDYAAQTGDKKWHFVHRLMIPTDKSKPYTRQLFKTFNHYMEESNPGWHFDWTADEKQYRGKLIGALINEREYETQDGKRRMTINIARFVTANTIRSGAYTVPNDQMMKTPPKETADFYTVDPVDDDDLPFN